MFGILITGKGQTYWLASLGRPQLFQQQGEAQQIAASFQTTANRHKTGLKYEAKAYAG